LTFSGIDLLGLAFAVALAGAFGGLWMAALPQGARMVISFSGGLLAGVALFGLLPELVQETGWVRGVPVFGAGYVLLMWLDRRWHPHMGGHTHGDVTHAGSGFTVPLLIAAAMHAFLDGWGLASAGSGTSAGVRLAFPIAIVLHKAPEGLALGAIFRAATGSRGRAFGLCFVAEAATFAGGWSGATLTPRLGSAWTNYPLAVAGGCFLYLGYHAVEGEWQRFGTRAVLAPALIGFGVAAVIQSGVRWVGI
jgi:zinc transporter ZupT